MNFFTLKSTSDPQLSLRILISPSMAAWHCHVGIRQREPITCSHQRALIFHQSLLSGQRGAVKPSKPLRCASRLKHSQVKYIGRDYFAWLHTLKSLSMQSSSWRVSDSDSQWNTGSITCMCFHCEYEIRAPSTTITLKTHCHNTLQQALNF